MAHHHHHGHHHAHGHDDGGGPQRFSDPAAESLSQALRSGFNVLRIIMLLLLVAYLLSGWFEVGTGEQGLIARFGELRDNPETDSPIFGPGWHFSMPEPFESKVLIPGEALRVSVPTFVFNMRDDERGKALAEITPNRESLDPATDGSLITGDRGLVHGLFHVEYRITDAGRFVTNLGATPAAAEPLMRRVVESAAIRTVAGLQAERVTTERAGEGAGDFTNDIQRRVNAELARLEVGLTVDKLTAETVMPGAVRGSFIAVSNAKNERQSLESAGLNARVTKLTEAAGARRLAAYENKPQYQVVLDAIEAYGAAQAAGRPDEELDGLRAEIDARLLVAGGEASRRLQEARAEAIAVQQRIEREYDAYVRQLEQFRRFPLVTATRLWVAMRTTVMSSLENEVFFVPSAGPLEIIVNRDEERLIRADRERYRQRQGGS